MKRVFVVYGGRGWTHTASEIAQLVGEAFAGGLSTEVTVRTSDKPTDLMRRKFHAMCADLARQVPAYKGAEMTLDRWKAICIGAAIEQEWLPAWGGNGVVPFRPSSENLRKKQYCDCIEVAYAIGAEFGVEWTEKQKEEA